MALTDIAVSGNLATTLAGQPKLKAKAIKLKTLGDVLAEQRWCSILFFGGFGSGKTRTCLNLLEMGYKVLYVLADFGKSGTNTITNEFVRRPELRKYAGNMRILEPPPVAEGDESNAASEWVSTLYTFLRNPEALVPDIYDFDPDFLFMDGYSSYQMCDLEASLIPEGSEFTRTNVEDWSTFRSDRNGTLFPLMKFLSLHNRRTGRNWSKIVTALDSEKGQWKETGQTDAKGQPKRELKPGSVKQGPLLNTSARQLVLAGFDIALGTQVESYGAKKSYSYVNQGDILSKDRNFNLPLTIDDASFTKLWREYLEPMLRPIEAGDVAK